MAQEMVNKGWKVVIAGTGINLALGVLYAWSVFKGAIKQDIDKGGAFNWDPASLNDPYAACCLVFALTMIVAGRIQDKLGPKKAAMAGGVLVGLGFILASQTTDYLSWIIGFGALAGAGIAFGYSSATPAALKWFPPHRTGRITGIVVAGFGLASVYIAPLSQYLLNHYGIQKAMLFYGVTFPIVVCFLAFFLVNPPEGYVPQGSIERRRTCDTGAKTRSEFQDMEATPAQMLKTQMFWMLWMLYFIGAGAGLMVIGSMAGMAKASMGVNAFLAVAILAIGNAGGRVAAGMLSDKIGRKQTLMIVFAFQSVLMFLSVYATEGTADALYIVMLATFIGFNYGANLALFPSYTKDLWGMKNFGVNYGIIFTAWGFGGLLMSRISQWLTAGSGSYRSSFILAGVFLIAGTIAAFMMRDKKEEMRRAIKKEMIAKTVAAGGK